MNQKTPSLHLGPAVVTERPSSKSAAEPQGLINKILRARGEYLVRVVKDPVEMARNAAAFVKAAASRGIVRIGRTGLEAVEVTRTGLEAADRGPEPQYVEPGNSNPHGLPSGALPGPSGNRGGGDVSQGEYDADGYPMGAFGPAKGPLNGVYSTKPRKLPRNDDAPYNLVDTENTSPFIKSYAKGLTEKTCTFAGCSERFMTAAADRSLCAKHAASKPGDHRRGFAGRSR